MTIEGIDFNESERMGNEIHRGVGRLGRSLNYGGMLLISGFLIYNVLNLGIFTVPLEMNLPERVESLYMQRMRRGT